VSIGNRPHLAMLLERRLFDRGANVAVVNQYHPALKAVGILAIVAGDHEPSLSLSTDDEAAVDEILNWLDWSGVFISEHGLADGEGI
jgi:hypothetical protein